MTITEEFHHKMKNGRTGLSKAVELGKIIILANRWVFSHFTRGVHHYCGIDASPNSPWMYVEEDDYCCPRCRTKVPENIKMIVNLSR